MKCIKCNIETDHSICGTCADGLLGKMSRKDLIAHALVGMDTEDGKGNLKERLKKYKAALEKLEL